MNARELRRVGRLSVRARRLEEAARALAEDAEGVYRVACVDYVARRGPEASLTRGVRELRGRWLRQAIAAEKRGELELARRFRSLAEELERALLARRDTPGGYRKRPSSGESVGGSE